MDYQQYIRNFSIIAHIDHGKSTLADRIIEKTGLVSKRDMKEQFLDNMDLERERGITIKLQTTRLVYTAKDGQEYIFNLIDTPGHVDFTSEVSRSLAACEGAVLVVDSTQGVEAQTMATVYLALDEDLEILPCLNKIDLASSRPDETKEEIEEMIGIDASEAPLVSAKEGIGVEDLLEEIVGDIRDEYDEDEEEQIRKISDLEYIVEGTLSLDDLNDYLDLEEKGLLLESEDFDSVGGIVIELLDRLPEVGDEVTTENGIRLVVESVEKNRIGQVHIYLPSPENPEELPEN